MPSSSSSSGFSSRAVISSWLKASVAICDSSSSYGGTAEHILRGAKGGSLEDSRERSTDGVRGSASSLRLRRARAAHRRADDARPPRQAPPGLRGQGERGARGHASGRTSRSRRCCTNLDVLPEDKQTAVRNNAGGHANHSLFWEIMSPDGGGEPDGDLAAAIDDDVRRLRRAQGGGQRTRASSRFGSGWAWLVHDGTGLAVVLDRRTRTRRSPTDDAAPRHRRLGARLLPQVPEPAARLPRRLVERRQLGRRRGALRPRGRGGGRAGHVARAGRA